MEGEAATAPMFGASWLLVTKTGNHDEHQYVVSGRDGNRLAVVYRQDVGPDVGVARRLVGLMLPVRPSDTVRLDVVADDRPVRRQLTVLFPSEDRKHRAVVLDPHGEPLGDIVKAKGVGKIHFDLRDRGVVVGTVDAEGWSGWDYRIQREGVRLGRITSDPASSFFGIPITSDDYLLLLDVVPPEPLRTLLVGCLVGMDASVGGAATDLA